jgi:hypothetical protein
MQTTEQQTFSASLPYAGSEFKAALPKLSRRSALPGEDRRPSEKSDELRREGL